MNTVFKILLILILMVNPAFGGVQFDNSDDLLDGADFAGIDAAEQLSGSCWVYHDTIDGTDDIMNKNNGTSDGWLFFRNNTGDKYSVTIRDGGDTDSVGASSADNTSPLATWTHVAFTYIEGNATGLNLYVNGVLSGAAGDTSSIGTINAFTAILNISGSGTGNSPFNGQITECALWNVVLTADEMLKLASSRVKRLPLQIQPSSLIGYWPLDEQMDGTSADGDTFYDLGPSGNNLTGNDGAGNTGLTAKAEEVLSYPSNY